MIESIWWRNTSIPKREALREDIQAEAAVIGGGLAGILTAYRLKQRGMRVVVLEADRIGSGQTGGTTAKITSQHGLIYQKLVDQFGVDRAAMYAKANQMAIREYERIIREEGISCRFQQADAYLYSTEDDRALLREAEAASSLGIDARFTTDTELPFPVKGAVCFGGQARFHPLMFLRAVSKGLEIYEDTRALKVEGNVITTPGGMVRAERIVFATHYPFVNMPGWYFLRMHQERSYVLALASDWKPEHMYLGIDEDGLSFREAEGCVLLGGGKHRTGENSAGGKYDMLRKQAQRLLPGSREKARWSAQDCMTLDGVPYIGQFSASTPHWYVATGFGKWGMTSSMAAAMLIAGQILGEEPAWAEVFSPQRFTPAASASSFAQEAAQAAKGLGREWLTLPDTLLDALPKGHGGIVEADGRKAGVYKDSEGRCHVIDPRCPHLGCQLEWNPDERTWDCPCHGSRFRYDGTLLDNPAQESLR